MHGVLKVKTTAEQEEERRKDKEVKAKKFVALTQKIFKKRKDGELDDEMLELTQKLLGSNPDFYTMWNIRKEILIAFKTLRTEDEMQKLFLDELKLLQGCLSVNPKSYGVWTHRMFCLENMPEPNWKNDLKLCNEFLSYDARNFHCWDYRRCVVQKAEISPDEELAFTKKKISENFSNYSAWHNRSKLLPLLHPVIGQKDKVEEQAILKEFEMVQNAFFTDPNDQSAWFYQRWLLGREEKRLEILHFGVTRKDNTLRIFASLSKPVKLSSNCKANLCIDGVKVENLSWKASDESNCHSFVWVCEIGFHQQTDEIKLKLAIENSAAKECVLKINQDEASWHWSQEDNTVLFRDEHTAAKSSVLENELESCKILLEEEKDNKWAMLTVVFLMRALNPEKYIKETDELLEKLMECDWMRKEYYLDLRSKHRIENELARLKRTKSDFETFDLQSQGLTTIYHWQYLTGFRKINLSSNNLKTLKGIHALQFARQITATDNKITNVEDAKYLQFLEELSIQNNSIHSADSLQELSKSVKLNN